LSGTIERNASVISVRCTLETLTLENDIFGRRIDSCTSEKPEC
jgi:hypothetical protein